MRLKWAAVLLGAIVASALVIAWQLGYFELSRREQIAALMEHSRGVPYIALVYVAAYAVVVVLVLPATLFSMLGGALFGPMVGVVLAWSGAMLGSLAAHLLSHSIGRRPAQVFLKRHPMLRRLRDRADVWTLVRLRVLPIAPFGVLDYVAGLSGVPLRTLLIATALGILPGTVAYVIVGHQLTSGLESEGPVARRGLWIAAGITTAMVTLSLVPVVVRRLRASRRSSSR
jgi:uncharacterized membrane protein YdjX (TVP38/TMEM64 family)